MGTRDSSRSGVRPDAAASSRPTEAEKGKHVTPATSDVEDGALAAAAEKPAVLFTINAVDGRGEEAIPEDDPRIRDLPPTVRRVVSLTDDPTLATFTFRYFVLSLLFVMPGAFLSMMSVSSVLCSIPPLSHEGLSFSSCPSSWPKNAPERAPRTFAVGNC